MKNFKTDPYRQFIFYRTYSRWDDEKGRRETWEEAVDRYMEFMSKHLGDKLSKKDYDEVRDAILKQDVMPSMRLLWSAGKAADKTNVVGYNCSYIAPTRWQDFAEILYLLTCGTGVGFSCEKKFVEQLPVIQPQTDSKIIKHLVQDSKEGWADAIALGMGTWANGKDIEFDLSIVRPAGSRLHTMGGRSSGPEPLKNLLIFIREKMLARQDGQLRTIDVHDIVCKIGEIVVSGGVRRSAEISLSDLTDKDLRDAKIGAFYFNEPQRSMANNSAVYNEKPPMVAFFKEWQALMESGSGERGIFNRGALHKLLPTRRFEASKGYLEEMGTNPCGEIILRNKQFCNLSEVVARAEDTGLRLLEKVRIATIIGTYQSSLTNFGYLSKEWKENCEAERLLGVSITGQFDSKNARNETTLEVMKEHAIKVNKEYARRFKINASMAVTCVKPSGTVSQLVNASSGMHPRYAPYYIRRVRIDANNSLFRMMKDQGIPFKPEVGQGVDTATTYVFEFPIKSPPNAKTNNGTTAMEQLEHWKMVATKFTEHNPSNTIFVSEDEWLDVGAWVWENWDLIGGLSFFPKTNHVYELAPYSEITKEEYKKLVKEMPEIDYSQLSKYELEDNTEGARELACAGNTCEIV